jgi:polysaccharide pyruvyl transferase WcaK-like protein
MRVPEWPGGRPRILVADAWLANAGDGAIAIATERRLRRLAPGAAILHAAYQGDLLAHAYSELEIVPPLSALVGLCRLLPEQTGWDRDACERLVAGADVVLSQGGGFVMEHYDPWERLRAWELVVERGIPIAFGAQTVGPFTRARERAILRRVYESAVVVALREAESVEHVTELGAAPERTLVTADEAFSLFPPEPSAERERRGIACVLSRHPCLRADGSIAHPGDRLDSLRKLVSQLVRLADGEHVTLLSTQQGLGHLSRGLEDDAEVAAAVVRGLPRRQARRIRLSRRHLPALECARAIGEHRALVSMRMHPAIFGLASGVPTVLANEGFKASGTFEGLGLGAALASGPALAADRLQVLLRRRPGEVIDLEPARRRAALNDEVVERVLAASAAPAR